MFKGLADASKIAVTGLRQYNMKFDLIYTSLLQRAHQTVKVIVEQMKYENVPIIYDWRLNERHYGNLTGFNKRQMANKYGEEKVSMVNMEIKPQILNEFSRYLVL